MKKLLNTIHVATEGTIMNKNGEHLVAAIKAAATSRVSLLILASVVTFGPIQHLLALIGACAGRAIAIAIALMGRRSWLLSIMM